MDSTKNTNQLREQGETRGLRGCLVCAAELQDRDLFCRRCGTRWMAEDMARSAPQPVTGSVGVATARLPALVPPTIPLAPPEPYHSVSGSLVNAVASGVSTGVSARLGRGVSGKLLAALLSVPLWLIIILLSPLDAFLASKSLLRQF
jgi:hypothetical protein